MNNKPIGVFDSGLGGLSCMAHLSRQFPSESFVYFGDTARTPYGDKAPETIRYFTCQVADFLASKEVKMLVIACNTISALCTDTLRRRYPTLPIVDIITPTVSHIAAQTQWDKPIGIIATKATIKSRIYEELLREKGVTADIYSVACPLFVPLIESGFRDGVVVESVVQHYLDDLVYGKGIGSLVLGCTHYPFIEESIRKVYPEIELVNPSQIIARQVQQILSTDRYMAEPGNEASHVFYASDLSDTFLEMIRQTSPDDEYSVKFQTFKEVYQYK